MGLVYVSAFNCRNCCNSKTYIAIPVRILAGASRSLPILDSSLWPSSLDRRIPILAQYVIDNSLDDHSTLLFALCPHYLTLALATFSKWIANIIWTAFVTFSLRSQVAPYCLKCWIYAGTETPYLSSNRAFFTAHMCAHETPFAMVCRTLRIY